MRSAKEKNMNKQTITTILTLIVCFSVFVQEAKGKDWTEEEWKKEKGSYGWVFPHIDKNADGKVTAAEYAEFQNYKKKHPNFEGSEIGKKTETEPLVTKAPETNAGIPQGIEALEASLNERMGEMFEKLDKNKDGKITVPECLNMTGKKPDANTQERWIRKAHFGRDRLRKSRLGGGSILH